MINIKQPGGGGIGSYIAIARKEGNAYVFEGDYRKMVTAFLNAEDVYLSVEDGEQSYCISLDGTYEGPAKNRADVTCPEVTFSGLYTTEDEIISFSLKCSDENEEDAAISTLALNEEAIEETVTLPAVPEEDGTYVLKATVASGVVTYEWVLEA